MAKRSGFAGCFFGLVALAWFAVSLAAAQTIARPAVPVAIQAASDLQVVLVAHASGSQIYTCQADAAGKLIWTLKAPDAELKDDNGKLIGTHFAGPSWKLTDGSMVTGKGSGHVDSEDASSIAWLLVTVTSHSGAGALSKVTAIQRIHTHNGKAPATGCDDSHRNAETKSGYTADYYFYAPAK
jgi:hypothetical protein